MRFTPLGRPQDYLTFRIVAPIATHWRPATCEEFECGAYARGWTTTVPSLGAQVDYIRSRSGRRFTEVINADGTVTFTFEPGQRCFGAADHRVALGRPAHCLVRHGDWRASKPLRTHSGPDAWLDDLHAHEEQRAHERE